MVTPLLSKEAEVGPLLLSHQGAVGHWKRQLPPEKGSLWVSRLIRWYLCREVISAWTQIYNT